MGNQQPNILHIRFLDDWIEVHRLSDGRVGKHDFLKYRALLRAYRSEDIVRILLFDKSSFPEKENLIFEILILQLLLLLFRLKILLTLLLRSGSLV